MTCLRIYLQNEAVLDSILPDLPTFAKIMASILDSNVKPSVVTGSSILTSFLPIPYILIELFRIAELLDLSDEASRKILSTILRDVLPVSVGFETQIPLIMKLLAVVHPDPDDYNRFIALDFQSFLN